ncbi:hypothetical protein [Butyrivibrio sp. AE3004]|uniref:hypothetical protein n=1 Tax=Butyrivibrio sp. AE3004 TaxID=1506994 RepID=UPI000494609A|nr:hypothetical protein [Butyrivibrio sp. AE3004]
MKKVVIKVLSFMLAFIIAFGAFGVTANAANLDKKAKNICKTLKKGKKAGSIVGKLDVKYEKQGKTYDFTVSLDCHQDASLFGMTAKMVPDKYKESRDSVGKAYKNIKKIIKKGGIKKCNVIYVVKANGVKLWEFKNGKLVFDKYLSE